MLILGTGGTSLTTRKAASDKGAASIRIASRHNGAEGETDHVIGSTPVSFVSYDDLPEIAESVGVIINATPVGTYPKNLQSITSLRDFPNRRGAMDVIYNPFRTALLLKLRSWGSRIPTAFRCWWHRLPQPQDFSLVRRGNSRKRMNA